MDAAAPTRAGNGTEVIPLTDAQLRNLPYLGRSHRGSSSMVEILGSVPDIAFVSLSSSGCDADLVAVEDGARRRGARTARLLGAGLGIADVVMGVEARLTEIVLDAAKASPRAILVRAKCCAAGRSEEELKDALAAVRRRVDMPVLLARCKSLAGGGRHPVRTGADPAWAAVPSRGRGRGTVFNRIDFGRDRGFANLLERSGLPWNALEVGCEWGRFEASGSATGSFGLSTVEFGNQWGRMLERDWKVPFHAVAAPYGFEGTRAALAEIGRLTGKEAAFRWLADSEEARWQGELAAAKTRLKGKRILPLIASYWGDEEAMLSLLRELGAEIPGEASEGRHWESLLGTREEVDSFYGEGGLGMGRFGGYKLLGMIRELRPDAVIAMHNGVAPWCARMGIPVLEIADPRRGLPFRGFGGAVRLGQKLSNLTGNPALFRTLARRPDLPYRESWLGTTLVRELQ